MRTVYSDGYEDGLQKALDIVCGNWDAMKKANTGGFQVPGEQDFTDSDIIELIARIVTDIQTEPLPK